MLNDIRLEKFNFEFDGKVYVLRCNMNVLADVQSERGSLPNITNEAGGLNTRLIYLAAMMNDYADEMGWPERFTPKSLGRKLDTLDVSLMRAVQRLVIHALYVPSEDNGQPEESQKN